MLSFFTDMTINPFLLRGLLAGVLAAIACGLVGPYVVVRRMVFLSGAVAHMAVGGVGAAVFLAVIVPSVFFWLTPLHGAIISALLAAIIIAIVQHRIRERIDTLIGAMWAIGMSIGIMLAKLAPGYENELMSYLFGNVSFVSVDDIWLMLALNVIIIFTIALFHHRLLAVCIDEEQAQLRGVSVLITNIVLMALVALTVICLIRIVGLLLVIALLALPAAAAGHHTQRLSAMRWLSIVFGIALVTIPRIAVYNVTINNRGLSPESTIVLAAGALYIVSALIHWWRTRRRTAT